MDTNFLRRLLAQGESSHLDCKSEQYHFAEAWIEDKAEAVVKCPADLGAPVATTNRRFTGR